MPVPCGVTPPPIISAMEPVTTTLGMPRIERLVGALHGRFGAVLAQFFFAKAGDDDGKLMRAAARRCSAAPR